MPPSVGVSPSTDTDVHLEAQQAWAALAPRLAGQPRVRLSRDRGSSYPQKFERELTEDLPSFPAAVRIFGKDGTCAALFLDFDSSVDGIDRVDADVRRVQDWLYRLGARWIEDYSPNGGRHLYVPLARRVPFTEARELVEALGNRYRSLDKSPHQNLLHGCMRTPGSRHKSGGYQQLAMSLAMAYDIVRRPNPAEVWAAMRADLAAEIAAVRALRLEQTLPPAAIPEPGVLEGDAGNLPAPGRMSRAMQRIAVTGQYDTGRYPTDSEARQGVILGAVAGGLSLTDVDRRMKQGMWPGLASFYARYPARHRMPALRRDWTKATSYLRQKPAASAVHTHVRKSPTSGPTTQGALGEVSRFAFADPANEHRFIRTWRNALRLCEHRYRESRAGMARRMILRALGEAAHKTGSRFVEFGARSLAVATGLDHTTVGSHLRALRGEPDALITLVEAGRGTHGDLYMLTIPEAVKDAAEEKAWRGGKLHALRPVFRELGLPAAFVYEALESSPTSLSITELVRQTSLSRSAVNEALSVLAAWNLASCGDGWTVVSSTSLSSLAEFFGVLEAVARQLHRYKTERALWHQWLAKRALTRQPVLAAADEPYPYWHFESLPEERNLIDILQVA